jgi:hypothetical protein
MERAVILKMLPVSKFVQKETPPSSMGDMLFGPINMARFGIYSEENTHDWFFTVFCRFFHFHKIN